MTMDEALKAQLKEHRQTKSQEAHMRRYEASKRLLAKQSRRHRAYVAMLVREHAMKRRER